MAVYERPEPALRSSREGEPEVELQIDAFVVGLGETIDSLQDAEASGQRLLLRQLAEQLVLRCRTLGYESLADVAQEIAEASSEPHADGARKAVESFTDLSKRVRRGHRSAAP
jgi:hypothetical protein